MTCSSGATLGWAPAIPGLGRRSRSCWTMDAILPHQRGSAHAPSHRDDGPLPAVIHAHHPAGRVARSVGQRTPAATSPDRSTPRSSTRSAGRPIPGQGGCRHHRDGFGNRSRTHHERNSFPWSSLTTSDARRPSGGRRCRRPGRRTDDWGAQPADDRSNGIDRVGGRGVPWWRCRERRSTPDPPLADPRHSGAGRPSGALAPAQRADDERPGRARVDRTDRCPPEPGLLSPRAPARRGPDPLEPELSRPQRHLLRHRSAPLWPRARRRGRRIAPRACGSPRRRPLHRGAGLSRRLHRACCSSAPATAPGPRWPKPSSGTCRTGPSRSPRPAASRSHCTPWPCG